MLLIVICDAVLEPNSVDLVLNNLLVSQNRLFHDYVVWRFIVGELEGLFVQFLLLVEKYIYPAGAHHTQ